MPKDKPSTTTEIGENVEEPKSNGSSTDSLNTETMPVPPPKEQAPPCGLCLWLEKRINNTVKEQIKHMEKYHVN